MDLGTFIVKLVFGKSLCGDFFFSPLLHPHLKAHNLICFGKVDSYMSKSLQFIPIEE